MTGCRLLGAVACLMFVGDVSLIAQQRVAQRRAAQPATSPPASPATQSARQTSRLVVKGRSADVSRPPLSFRSPGHVVFPLVLGWGGVPYAAATFDAPLSPPDAPTGGVQLDVQPWRASVFVDGEYAGRVDDFNGYYKHLEVPAGPHQIVIVEDGYDPLVIDVVVAPGRTVTYRGTLTRSMGR